MTNCQAIDETRLGPAAPLVANCPDDLSRVAVNCYLSTVLAVADCMAAVCPDIGTSYQKRLSRLPTRLGFDLTPVALEKSRASFEADIQHFSQTASEYVRNGPSALENVVTSGAAVVDAIAERVGSLVNILESLADRIELAVDLEGPAQIREVLGHQPAGLRMCAQQIEQALLPSVGQLQTHMRESQQNLQRVKESVTVDQATGFVNRNGFEQQLDFRLKKRQAFCIVVLECAPGARPAENLNDEQLGEAVAQIAVRLASEFRPYDIVCRLDSKRFAVIFCGNVADARARVATVVRNLSGKYMVSDGDATRKARVDLLSDVLETENRSIEELLARIDADSNESASTKTPEPQDTGAEFSIIRLSRAVGVSNGMESLGGQAVACAALDSAPAEVALR